MLIYVKIVNMQNRVKLTNQALMVKTKDITNILMEEIFCIYFAKKSTEKRGSIQMHQK